MREEIQNNHIVTNGNHPCSTFGVKDLLSSQSLRRLCYIIWFLCSCHLITDIVEYNAFTKSYVGSLWESSDTLTIKYCVTKLKENESECFFNNIINKWSTAILSSVADPTIIANLLPNKGESEILYSSQWWKSEDRMLREYIYLRVMKNCFLMVAVFPWMKLVNHHQSNMDLSIWSFWFLCFKICIMISSQFWVSDFW